MAVIQNILNLVECGLAATLGTGTKGCKPFFKKVYSMWLTPQGFTYDKSRTLDATYINELKAEGKLIVLRGIRTFTDNTPDDDVETLEDGTEDVIKLGLYKFAVNFVNGLYYHAALHSLNSYGNFDITMVDIDGNILGTKAADGSLKGFTVGMLHAMKLQWQTDTTKQREGLMLQLLERDELDADYVFIQRKQLDGYNPKLEEGVNEVELSWNSLPASGTSLEVVAKLKQDGSVFTGADFNDFTFIVDGATSNPTAGDDSAVAGTYVLTVAAISTNESVTISLYDQSNNRPAIAIDGETYKSNDLSAVVA